MPRPTKGFVPFTKEKNLEHMHTPTKPVRTISGDEDRAFEYIAKNDPIFVGIESCQDPVITPPCPVPESGDWLAEHTERGQSFASFTKGRQPSLASVLRGKGEEYIFLVILGEGISDHQTQCLTAYVSAFYQLRVQLVKVPVESAIKSKAIRSRINDYTHQRQLWAGDCLRFIAEHIRKQYPSAAPVCTMGVTMEDVTKNEEWNFLYGLASREEWSGIFSMARFSPRFNGEVTNGPEHEEQVILERSCKVVTHEIGHIFGLSHCINHQCLMNGANHVGELESQRLVECPCCTKKLAFSCRWDLKARYEALSAVGKQLQFPYVVDFVDNHMLPLLSTLPPTYLPVIPERRVRPAGSKAKTPPPMRH